MNHISNRESLDLQPIKLKPIINYPREAQVGQSYLMTIDVQLAEPKISWNYPEEEYAISFVLNTQPYFSYEPLGGSEPTIVLHCFGGTYGPAKYQLTAANEEIGSGKISIMFMNGWGVPIASIELECAIKKETELSVKKEITIVRQSQKFKNQEMPTEEREATRKQVQGQDVTIHPSEEQETNISLIEEQLRLAGWIVQEHNSMNVIPPKGIAVKGYPSFTNDYLLFINNTLAGLVKVKQVGEPLTSTKEPISISQILQLWTSPSTYGTAIYGLSQYGGDTSYRTISFVYESNGNQTNFTNYLEPKPRSRTISTFHPPETLAMWIKTGGPDYRRPATVFLSYSQQSTGEVAILEQQLKLRGVNPWRNVADLQQSRPVKEEITYAIAHQTDALLIYLTPESLASSFIWEVEIPAALERYESDHSFSIIPVLRGVTLTEVQHLCDSYGLHSLNEFNCISLPDLQLNRVEFNREQRKVANRILNAALRLRLRRVQADDDYEPSICLHTFKDRLSLPSLDLDLNWYDLFLDRNRLPSQAEWQEMLFPALLDVKDALGELRTSRRLHISLQSILPAAFVLGSTFPATTSFTLLLMNQETEWSSNGPIPAPPPLRCISYNEGGDSHVAIVEIAIAQLTASAVSKALLLLDLSYGHHLQFSLPEGPNHAMGVKDASHARAMAHQIGKELRSLCGKGVSQVHLFAAIPAALAVLIGRHFSVICPIIIYEYSLTDGTYKQACTLLETPVASYLLSIAQSLLPSGVSVIRSHYQQEQALLQIICTPGITQEDKTSIKTAFRRQVGDAYTLGISSTRKLKTPSLGEKFQIATALLECSSIHEEGSRETILAILNDDFSGIVHEIPPVKAKRAHAINILNACLKRPGSLDTLVDIVAFFNDEESTPVQNLRRVMHDIFFETPDADPKPKRQETPKQLEERLLSVAQPLLPSGVSVIRSHYQQEQALLQIICTPGISPEDRTSIKAAFRRQAGDTYTLGISPILKSSASQSKSQSDLQERLLSIAQSLLPPGVSVIRSHYQQEQALLQIICSPGISPEDRISIKAAFRRQAGDTYTLGISPILKSSASQSKSQSDLQERLLSIAQSLLPPGVSVIRSHYQQEQALLQIICSPGISPEDRISIKAAFRKQVGNAYALGISQSV